MLPVSVVWRYLSSVIQFRPTQGLIQGSGGGGGGGRVLGIYKFYGYVLRQRVQCLNLVGLKTGIDLRKWVCILETRSENVSKFYRPRLKKSTRKLHILV